MELRTNLRLSDLEQTVTLGQVLDAADPDTLVEEIVDAFSSLDAGPTRVAVTRDTATELVRDHIERLVMELRP